MAANQVLGGAASGAAAGSAIMPGWGTLIGGAAGGLMGAFQDDPEAARKAAVSDYQGQMKSAMDTYTGSQGKVLQNYDDLWDLNEVKGAKTAYTSAASSANPEQWQVDQHAGAQTYTDAKDMAQSYLDPSIKLQQEAARKNVEESAAGQGGLYSGAAAREIAADTADIAAKGWQQAFENAASEQTRANTATTQTQQNAIQAGRYNSDLTQTDIANKKDVYGTEREVMDLWSSGQSDLNKTLYGGQTSAAQTALQAGLGESGGNDLWGDIAGAAGAAKSIKSLWGK